MANDSFDDGFGGGPQMGFNMFQQNPDVCISHRIHGAGLYANMGYIGEIYVTIYGIHGSYGYLSNGQN